MVQRAYVLEDSKTQGDALDWVSFGAKKWKEVLNRHLDDIKNERYQRLIEMMKTIFYAYCMEESYLVHVEAMYDVFWGAFLHDDRILSGDEDEAFYENEECYKAFLRYIIKRTIKECEEIISNSKKEKEY